MLKNESWLYKNWGKIIITLVFLGLLFDGWVILSTTNKSNSIAIVQTQITHCTQYYLTPLGKLVAISITVVVLTLVLTFVRRNSSKQE